MTDPRNLSQEDRRLFRIVGEVLHYVWDPIGVAGVPQARDEYDNYVPQVFSLLRAGSDKAVISEYLQQISEGRMGLSKLTDQADDAASVLVDWRDHINEIRA